MSTPFYDLASLVLVPSGYKAQKVYAQKPLTTDGQLTFSRASTATRVNSAGLIETVSSNVPRLDYQGSTCPKLLLEPSRTNLMLHSNDAGSWNSSKSGSFTANAAISPDGTQNAFSQVAGDSDPYAYQNLTLSTGTYTYSCYLKGVGTAIGKNFSLRIGSNTQVFTIPSAWTRFTYSVSVTAGSYNVGFEAPESAAVGDTIYGYGFQLELGSYVTSLIPTTSAAVTRLADFDTSVGSVGDFNLTPTGTKAVLFWEYQFNPGDVGLNINIGGFRNGTTNQYGMYYWGTQAGTQLGFNSWSGDAYGITGAHSLFDGQIHKIAGVFDFNNFANNVLFIDGVKKTISQVRGTTVQRGANKVSLNSPDAANQGNKGVLRKFMYFNQNLTDAQLAELTAL